MTERTKGALRVLVIDDDEVDRMSARRALRVGELTADVVEASGSREGLSLLACEKFDCILLDLLLPGKSGLEVLQEARAAGIETPIIMLTGHGSEETAVELMKAGASDYISKASLTPERLQQAIRHVLRVAEMENKTRVAEDSRRRSEERLRSFVEATAHVVWATDASGAVVDDLPTLNRFTGQVQSALVGDGWLRSVHPDDRALVAETWSRAVAAGTHFEHEYRLLRSDGSWRYVLSRGVPVRNDDGTVREWIGTIIDVTERKEAELESQRRADFEQQLIGIVSHDLRNPLSVISMAGELLKLSGRLDARDQKTVARIISSNARALRLIEDLLDFTRARLGSGIPVTAQPADVHEVVRRAVEESQAANPTRALTCVCTGDGRGAWDPHRLEQVLANLITNAVRYGDPRAAIRVESRGAGDEVFVEVHNWGNPIAPELRALMFEPYRVGLQTESSARVSVGLGLFIVAEIVRAHGGAITVESSLEEGTSFRVRLPRCAPETTI